jgi:hypothetical protein
MSFALQIFYEIIDLIVCYYSGVKVGNIGEFKGNNSSSCLNFLSSFNLI